MGVSGEFSAAALRRVLAQVNSAGVRASRRGLADLGDAMAKQARTNASTGRHAYGTPTPARPGTGPAVISGTLKKSIIRTAVVRNPAGWQAKVGLRPGSPPSYRKNGGWGPSKYGHALETGLKNGARYPFLTPATRMAALQAAVVFGRTFAATDWSPGSSA